MNQTDVDELHPPAEPQLRVYLFGPLRATWQGIPLAGITRPQLQALLAYLLLVHRHRPVPREHLAFTFWPGGSEAQARNSLRQHLYLLQQGLPQPPTLHLPPSTGFEPGWKRGLGSGGRPSPLPQRGRGTGDGSVHWLLHNPDEIRVNPQAQLWVDVWAFEDGLTRGEAELEAAVQLVKADLLPDHYDDWLTVERERLRITYSRALTRLALLKQRQGDRPAALAWAQRLVAHEAWNEEAQCFLIALHYANGDRTAALEQFKDCQRILRDEAGVAPSPGTLALRDAVMQSQPLPAPWSDFQLPLERIAAQILEEVLTPPQPRPLTMPFVGREAELQHLVGHWRQTTSSAHGSRSIVLVGGEAGVGKTRLLSELAGRVEHSGGQVLWGHCYAFEHHIPYQPVVEALNAALPQLAASSIPLVWLAEAARLLPDLRELRPDIPEPAELQGEQAQARLMEGLNRCLMGLAAQQPRLLLLEDLHWAADSTLTWLHAMSRQAVSASLLIVGSYRQEEVGAGHPLREWIREVRHQGWGTLLTLHPLAAEAVQTLVQALSGLGESAVGLARQLQAESEGNPFFLSELLRYLQEIGQLRRQVGRWAGPWVESAAAGEERRLPLPESVRETILARVERLSGEARKLLGYAAVAGREFDLKVVQAAIGWGEEQTLDALEELLERGLVREGEAATGRDHMFNHHLVQEVTYGDLPWARRQVRHRRVGEAMAGAYGEEAAGEVAYHFEHAGMKEQALKYLKLAGDQAAARYANTEALDYYNRALTLLADGGAQQQPIMRFDLLAARAAIWGLLGQRDEQRADLAALEELARSLGDDTRLARVYLLWSHFYEATANFPASVQAAGSARTMFQNLGDQHGEGDALLLLGLASGTMSDGATLTHAVEQVLVLSRATGDRAQEGWALHNLGVFTLMTGDMRNSRTYFEQAVALFRAADVEEGLINALYQLSINAGFLADFPAARAYGEEALGRSRAIGDRRSEARSLGVLMLATLPPGDFDACQAYQAEALALAQATGDKDFEGWAHTFVGQLALYLGDIATARQHFEQALALAQEVGSPYLITWAVGWLGGFLFRVNEYEKARTMLEQSLSLARQGGAWRMAADSSHYLGQLAWAQHDSATAVGYWREAIGLKESIGRLAHAKTSRTRLAEALATLNQVDEARTLAEAVWAAWQAEPPLGEELDEIRQGYLALARTFTRLDEPQAAQACLEQAHAFVQGRLPNISNEDRRQSFLTQVPVNREIEAEYAGFRG